MRAILISTGDEITQGDVLNTTGPAIARRLAERSISIVKCVSVPDKEAAIQAEIELALAQADLVFLTGGLGPTSDDLTRYALAAAIKEPLIFNEYVWQSIVTRLSQYKLHIHEDNRRQAYFPEDAEIFDNPHGTAAGCKVKYKDTLLYMLPGPPHECLPMFESKIIDDLPKIALHKIHWLLMGVSEGETAAKIDAALKNLSCQTGYRAAYPYLEIKVWLKSSEDLITAQHLISPLLKDYLVSEDNITASQLLQTKILREKRRYTIFDSASKGVLESSLTNPDTAPYLCFVDNAEAAEIKLTGLDTFWAGTAAPKETIIQLDTPEFSRNRKAHYRDAQIRNFAAEWACWQLL